MSNKRKISVSENRNFEGVWIPAKLYLSNTFNPKEKFLLLEIKSLQNVGDCFATDKHFADFIGVSERMIQTMLSKLKKMGYISVQYEYEENTRAIKRRYLYLTDKYYDEFINESEKNFSGGTEKNCNRGGEKNCGEKYNNIFKNNNINNTDDAFNSNELKDGDQVHASFPEEKEENTPQSHDKSISKTNYTYEELKSYLKNKLPELYMQEHLEVDERINDLLKIVLYFYKQYKIYRGENHPILSDIAYRKIVIEYLCPPETMSTYGEFSFDAYKDMIDKYFNTEYGKYGGMPENFNYRLSHFMSDNIREHLYRQVTGL